jgi:Secretion system C-terminal sorting domain
MKKIILSLITIFISIATMAQTDTDTTYDGIYTNDDRNLLDIADEWYQHLDKAKMPTTTFYNRILAPMAWPMLSYDSTSYEHLSQTWFELENANYHFTGGMPYITTAKWAKYYAQEHILPIALINCGLHTFDTNAVNDNTIQIINDAYYDGPANSNGQAYIKSNSLLAGIYAESVYQNQAYNVLFSNLLLQNNNDFTITKIELSIERLNKVFEIIKDKPIPLEFTEAGNTDFMFTLTMSNNTKKIIHQTIYIIPNKKTRANLDLNLCNVVITPLQGRSFMQPDNNANNFGARVQVGFYRHFSGLGNCDTMLGRPIIFLDGYDDSSTRLVENIYRDRMMFLNPLNASDSMRVGDSLRHAGYDVFIFNPAWYLANGVPVDGGTDYIERNAYALEALIMQINQHLAWQGNSANLVIVGPSMGGQISRYALADMERAGVNHNCRLWVSFDSPHHGANIAPGIQAYIKYMAQVNAGAKQTLELRLLAPAAREQIIHQTMLTGKVYNVAYNNTSYDRVRWMDTLALLGFPQQCKNITIASGHGNGGNVHAPCTEIFRYKAKTKNWVKWVSLLFPGISVAGYASAKFESTAYYFPDFNNTCKLFDACVNLKVPLVPIWYKAHLSISATNTIIYGSLDGVPGGTFNLQQDIYKQGTFNTNLLTSSFPFQTFGMTFIPTWSSLAMRNPNTNWATPINPLGNLVCNNLIPFTAFRIQPTNESHTNISANTYHYMLHHLNTQNFGPQCAPICATKLTAPGGYACVGDIKHFSLDVNIPALPSTAFTTWSASAGIQLTPIDNNNVDALILPNASQFESVTATIHHPCDTNTIINAPFWTGTIAPGSQYYFTSINALCHRFVTLSPVPGTNTLIFPNNCTFKWSYDDITYFNSSTPNIEKLTILCTKNNQNLYCKVYTQCGGYFGKYFGVIPKSTDTSCSCKMDMSSNYIGPQNLNVSIYPNPSNTDWHVSLEDFENIKEVQLKLYDISGKVIWSKYCPINNFSNITIPSINLQVGVYILKIITENQNNSYKLIKE